MSKITEDELSGRDFSFDVASVVAKPYTHLYEALQSTLVRKYTKSWPSEDEDFSAAKDASEQVIFALVDETRSVHGYVYAFKDWNNLVTLHNFGVQRSARRGGNGRKLFAALVEWAKGLGVKGLRVETQDTNVAACAFYKSVGCVFGGFDEYLYAATGHAGEVAIFWYYFV